MGGQAMVNPRAGGMGSGFGNGNVPPYNGGSRGQEGQPQTGGQLPGYGQGGQNIANDPGFALQPGQMPGNGGGQLPGIPGVSGPGANTPNVGGIGNGGAVGGGFGQNPFPTGPIQGDPGQGISQNPFGRGRGLLGGGSVFANPYLRTR